MTIQNFEERIAALEADNIDVKEKLGYDLVPADSNVQAEIDALKESQNVGRVFFVFLSNDSAIRPFSLFYGNQSISMERNANTGEVDISNLSSCYFDLPYGNYNIEVTSENGGEIISTEQAGDLVINKKAHIFNIGIFMGEAQVTTQ